MPFIHLSLADGTQLGDFTTIQPLSMDLLRDFITILWPATASLQFEIFQTVENEDAPPVRISELPADDRLLLVLGSLTSAELGPRASPYRRMTRNVQDSANVAATASPSTPPSSGNTTTPQPEALPLTARDLKIIFQAKMKGCAHVRDRGCVITGLPFAKELQCAHVLTPPFAQSYFSAQPMERGQLAGEPKVLRTNGMIEYRDGYDVRNSIMLSAGIHGSFKNVHWSIYEHNGQLKTFVFKPCSVPMNSPVRLPNICEFAGMETYFRDRFPHPSLFRQHFIQAVLRNFWAAGAPDEAEPRDEEDMGVEAGVDDDDEYSQLSLDDEALHRAWRSGDIVVDENFFIS